MASKLVTRKYADGTTRTNERHKQGRKPSGLGKPKLYSLYEKDEIVLREMREKYGVYYNENELVREAVHKVIETVYMELVKT